MAAAADPPQAGPTLTVNTTADHDDGTCGTTDCTLREAVQGVNASASATNAITFASGIASQTIELANALGQLPAISKQVTIDGRLPASTTVGIGVQGPGGAGAMLAFGPGSAGSIVKGLALFGSSATYVDVGADNVTIAGNYIGLRVDGVTNFGNMPGYGIRVTGNDASIGGVSPGDGNVIAQTGYGISFDGATGGWAKQNIVGLDDGGRSRTSSTPTSSAFRSTTRPASRSVILRRTARSWRTSSRTTRPRASGSGAPGSITAVGGNRIGVSTDGTTPAGNGVGLQVVASGVTQTNVLENMIRSNAGHFATKGDRTNIYRNSIDANGGLGIDLGVGGVTANDHKCDGLPCCPADSDSGPNGLQNFPDLASAAVAGSQVTIEYSLETTPGGTYRVEFFASAAVDPSGHGEGARYLGFDSITLAPTDVEKSGTVTLTPSAPVLPGEAISATAIDATGNTSEFSAARTAVTAVVGSLSGARSAPSASPIDLTAAGTTSWAVWGFDNGGTSNSLTPDVRKAGGSAMSALTDVNTPSPIPLRGIGRFNPPFTFSWSNGSTPASVAVTAAKTGIQHNGGAPTNVRARARLPVHRAGRSDLADAAGLGSTEPRERSPHGNALGRVGHSVLELVRRRKRRLRRGGVHAHLRRGVGGADVARELGRGSRRVRRVPLEQRLRARRGAIGRRDSRADTPPLVTGLTIAGPATVDAGASIVPLAGIPPAALVVPQTSGTQAAPVNQSPVNQSPVNQLPVNQLPVNQSPVNQSPVNQLPVNQSPVNQSGLGPDFKSLAIAPGPLGDTALATIPLRVDGGWGKLLTGTSLAGTPLQSVTLRQVFGLNPLPARLQAGATNPLRFADIDFSRSLFGSLPAMTLALGQLPLSGIPGVDWCAIFSGPPLNCTGTLPTGTSLLSAALEGAPVNQSPVNQSPVNQSLIDALATAKAPVNQLPVNQLPVNQLPVNQLPVNQSRILSFPVNQLPVNQTPVNQSPVNQLSLSAILTANAPVNQSPVNQLPVNQLPVNQSVLDCGGAQCQGKLGDYVNKVLPGQTLGDLRRAFAPGDVPDTWTIANLEEYGTLIVGDLLASLPQPNDLTLADVLALALFANNPEGFAFETLNIFDTGLSLYANPVGAAPYTVAFTLAPDGGLSGVSSTVDVSVTLPRTFAYAKGTSKLVTGVGTCATGTATAEPVLSQVTSGQTKVTKATWTVTGTVGSLHKLCFTTSPGIVLGPQSATTSAKPAGGLATDGTAPEPVTVVDGGESSNNNAPTAPSLSTTNLYLSYLTSAADVDYYRVAVPAVGTRLTFHLSHLPADYDLVVYGPEQTPLRAASPSTPPLDGLPVTDSGAELTHATDALPPQTLDDLRLQTLPIVGVSANRGSDPEDITVLSDGSGGWYTVQVTSYNDATSADPYMLRVTTQAPLVPVSTPARTVTGGTGAPVGALPSGFNTLFLVNRQRLTSFYPGAGPGTGAGLLDTLAAQQTTFAQLGFPNAVLSVDAYPAVQTAYGAWDADPGNPDKANKVVAAINAVVDTVRAQPNGAGLKYLAILGGDRVIPQGRLGDFTVVANESGYADTFDPSSDLYATLRASQTLSDDPYGTLEPVPYLNRQLHIPRLAVGRLVETPAEISATLTRFGQFGGRLDPSTSLTTGYDFMKDGAASINTQFASRLGTANAQTLISDTWLKSDLLGAFLPAGGAPAITSLNGHADHFEFAPPSPRPPYLTTADLPLGHADTPAANTGKLVNRLVFSMGCHSGLSVSDATVTANTYDWAQAYSRNGVGAYLGNTGYGYGDSLVVAYSEQLDSIFANKLAAGATVGNALAAAKQEYFGGLGVFGVYDEKAMAEFTLYGLPDVVGDPARWRPWRPWPSRPHPPRSSGGPQLLAVQAAAVAPTSSSVVTDSATGLQAEAFVLDNIVNTPHCLGARQLLERAGRRAGHPLSTAAAEGLRRRHGNERSRRAHHGAAAAAGHVGVNPVFARPIVDAQADRARARLRRRRIPVAAAGAPHLPQGRRASQRVVLMTGQFFTGSDPGANGVGVQRLYTRIGARVLRSTSNDYVPPVFTRIDATKVGTTAAFAVDVTDLTQSGGAGVVKRVLVAVRSGAETTWTFTDLGQSAPGSARWAGGVPLSGSTFEYFVQAVDAAGNVAVSTNKGFYFAAATPAAPSGNITVAPAITVPPSGWFTEPTGVVAYGPTGVTLEVSVDGGPSRREPGQRPHGHR